MGHYDLAASVYDFALWKTSNARNRAEYLAGKGSTRLDARHWLEAYKLGKQAIALDPNSYAARMLRVHAALMLVGKDSVFVKPIEEDAKALREIDPSEHMGFFLPAKIMVMRGNTASALDYLNEAIDRNSWFAESRFIRGLIHSINGDVDAAALDLELCTRLAPRYKPGFKSLAQIYVRTNADAKAIRVYEALLALGNPVAEDLNNIAWLYATSEIPTLLDGDKALRYAEMAVKLEPSYVHLDTLGAAYARAGRYDKAAEVQTMAIAELQKEQGDLPQMQGFVQRLEMYERDEAFVER